MGLEEPEDIIAKLSESLSLTVDETLSIVRDALDSPDPQESLLEAFGFEHIEGIFYIVQNKELFQEENFKNEEVFYVEHTIPPVKPIRISEEALIPTKILGKESIFFNYTKFNSVQSEVFAAVYCTQENILISAPTGAGKTDIALLAIIQVLCKRKGRAKELKAVYIAPMKALATEITRKYSKVLSKGGFRVTEFTGDTKRESLDVNNSDVIVCTPEKLDVVSRRLNMLITGIRLVVVDEIHLLGETRGAVLETLMLRLKAMSEKSQTKIRVVGLSATLPNYKDVAEFIGARHVFSFDQRYRPVPLSVKIVGFKKGSKRKDRNGYLLDFIRQMKLKGKQTLVFVSSRAQTAALAKLITGELKFTNKMSEFCCIKPTNSLDKPIKEKNQHEPSQQCHEQLSSQLRHFVDNRIGIHHAGMPRRERMAVERLFSESQLDVLVCTSTLAWGVNLPAHAVVIFGTSFYDASRGCSAQLGILDVMQIFGRAGRPQFDVEGTACLITEASRVGSYLDQLKGSRDIESKLLHHLVDALSAEIYLRNIGSSAEAVRWLRGSFLYIRICHNPEAYGICTGENLPAALNDYVCIALQRLKASCMINLDSDSRSINLAHVSSTVYGRTGAIYYISYLTIHSWLAGLATARSDEEFVLSMLLSAHEFSQVSVRNEENDHIQHVNDQLLIKRVTDYDFDGSRELKLQILFHAYTNFISLPVFSLQCDLQFILDSLERMVPALKEILLYQKRWDAFRSLAALERKTQRREHKSGPVRIQSRYKIRAVRIGEYIDLTVAFNTKFEHRMPYFREDIATNTRNTAQHRFGLSIIIYEENTILRCASSAGQFREFIRAPRKSIEVELFWAGEVARESIEVREDYSISALHLYGMHSCDGLYTLGPRKDSCCHILTPSKGNSLDETGDKRLIRSFNNLNLANFNEETYSNLILPDYVLRISFVTLSCSDVREELRSADYEISTLSDEKPFLYVCSSREVAVEVASFLTTLRALANNYSAVEPVIIGRANESACHRTVSFQDLHRVMQCYARIVFRGCRRSGAFYPVAELLQACDRKEVTIYENEEFVEYLRTITDGE